MSSQPRSARVSNGNKLRSKVVNILDKRDKIKEQNIGKQERKAIEDMKKDETIMVLPADKGRV